MFRNPFRSNTSTDTKDEMKYILVAGDDEDIVTLLILFDKLAADPVSKTLLQELDDLINYDVVRTDAGGLKAKVKIYSNNMTEKEEKFEYQIIPLPKNLKLEKLPQNKKYIRDIREFTMEEAMEKLKTTEYENIEEERKNHECFEWLQDFYEVFVEQEDHQRNKESENEVLNDKKTLRDAVKRVDLRVNGLTYEKVANVCHGTTTKIKFDLYVKLEKIKENSGVWARAKRLWGVSSLYGFGSIFGSGTLSGIFGSVFGGLTTVASVPLALSIGSLAAFLYYRNTGDFQGDIDKFRTDLEKMMSDSLRKIKYSRYLTQYEIDMLDTDDSNDSNNTFKNNDVVAKTKDGKFLSINSLDDLNSIGYDENEVKDIKKNTRGIIKIVQEWSKPNIEIEGPKEDKMINGNKVNYLTMTVSSVDLRTIHNSDLPKIRPNVIKKSKLKL